MATQAACSSDSPVVSIQIGNQYRWQPEHLIKVHKVFQPLHHLQETHERLVVELLTVEIHAILDLGLEVIMSPQLPALGLLPIAHLRAGACRQTVRVVAIRATPASDLVLETAVHGAANVEVEKDFATMVVSRCTVSAWRALHLQ